MHLRIAGRNVVKHLIKLKNKIENIEIEEDSFEINANDKDSVIIQRYFTKHTKLDLEIQNLPIPKKSIWLNIVVRMLRFYQKNISEKLGNRCVFDPSCSRYSELAFREKGLFKGMSLTINRLKRCRPENGGIDQLN
jgi:uncharacterized protein